MPARACQDAEGQFEVVDVARHRTHDIEVGIRKCARRRRR